MMKDVNAGGGAQAGDRRNAQVLRAARTILHGNGAAARPRRAFVLAAAWHRPCLMRVGLCRMRIDFLPIARTMALALVAVMAAAAARAEDDSFIRGYAAAVLQRDFGIGPQAVSVRNGVVTVQADLAESEIDRVRTAVMEIANRELFRPLIADPRWPRFAVAYD